MTNNGYNMLQMPIPLKTLSLKHQHLFIVMIPIILVYSISRMSGRGALGLMPPCKFPKSVQKQPT